MNLNRLFLKPNRFICNSGLVLGLELGDFFITKVSSQGDQAARHKRDPKFVSFVPQKYSVHVLDSWLTYDTPLISP